MAAASSGVIIAVPAQTGQRGRGVPRCAVETTTRSMISTVVTVLFLTPAPSSGHQRPALYAAATQRPAPGLRSVPQPVAAEGAIHAPFGKSGDRARGIGRRLCRGRRRRAVATALFAERLPVVASLHSFETEFRAVLCAVVESDEEHPTRSSPGSVGLPDVVVLVRRGAVAQATAARGDSFFYDCAGLTCVARDRARRGVTRGEDRQPLIPA